MKSVSILTKSVAHIAVDPERRIVFWTQESVLYSSSFRNLANVEDKSNYKQIMDFTKGSSIVLYTGQFITQIVYDVQNGWLYLLQITPYPAFSSAKRSHTFGENTKDLDKNIIRIMAMRPAGQPMVILHKGEFYVLNEIYNSTYSG